MSYTRLLAKSSDAPETPRRPETLAGHLGDVTRVAQVLVERWGDVYLASLGLPTEEYGPALRRALPRAAFWHDTGKCSAQFQAMVRAPRGSVKQALRHEWLSVWLTLQEPALGAWLFAGCSELERQAVLAAVAGHHLQVEDGRALRVREGSGSLSLEVLAGHADFRATLEQGAALLGLGEPPEIETVAIDLIRLDVFADLMRDWLRTAVGWWRKADGEERRFVAVLKALVIAADVAGSAIPRERRDAAAWTDDVLGRVCHAPEMAKVVTERLPRGETPRPFQRAVAASASRVTFVRAGCGTGKTAAAYLWAERAAAGRKLFVCYPTTGTASQGFSDYVPASVTEAALVHSRSVADIAEVLPSGGERDERLEWLMRHESLATWDAPVTVCTVDTVLCLIQNARRGLFSSAAIGNGAFVFDEIHQYDERLFGALIRFLQAFRGVPVLLMTASLPRARLALLQATLAGMGERLTVVEGPAELEALKRYRLRSVSEEEGWLAALAAVRAGRRVLWVANTVDRAVARAETAETAGLPVLPYHSRFKYVDRRQRHDDVVRAFGLGAAGGVLAVTTQVCEVSLDLSAELLVTELAPAPALIQRMGRLNRWLRADEPVIAAEALVIEPASRHPYEDSELDLARRWLLEVGEGAVSQADLAAAFERVSDAVAPGDVVRSAWLDGGVLSAVAPCREESTTIPVLMTEDAARVRALTGTARRAELVRLTLPMPLSAVANEIGGWASEGATFVAPAGRVAYTERFGGTWQ